jgi:hypothetical protein
MPARCSSPCDARLAQAWGTRPTPLDPGFLAAALRHRGEAGLLWACSGGGGALPRCAAGDEEAGGKDRPGAWQGSTHGAGGRALGAWCQGLGAVDDRGQAAPERSDEGLDQERMRGDHPRIRRQGYGSLDGLDAGSDAVGVTYGMGAEAALAGGAARTRGGVQGWAMGGGKHRSVWGLCPQTLAGRAGRSF